MSRITILTTLLLLWCSAMFAIDYKPRVIVLTDIENEPDDAMSMVRFLTYSNQWDVEGLVATTSVHQKKKLATWRIREIVDAYEKVQPNLLKHEPGYPTGSYLKSVIKEGRADYGMHAVGPSQDSEGSDWIIQTVDKADNRPVWVLVWGGPNCLAQALWKVRQTRTAEELETFVGKLRVYAISDQDDSGPWIRRTFKNLFYIVSPGYHRFGGYHYGTWSGISGDHFHGRFAGGNFSIVDNPWLDEHIRSKGPLGEQYPFMKFLMEGDSPTFLYLINNGLANPEHPDWGSWGGRYEYYQPRTERWFLEPETRPIWTDAQDEVMGMDGYWHTSNKATIWRWRQAFQNDFEARMDWTIKKYKGANHPPVVKLSCAKMMTAHVGDTIRLSADGCSDPDGNQLSYEWFYYPEVGTMNISSARSGNPLKIENANQAKASFVVPKTERYGTMHIIVAVTDNGKPALTRYERVIIDVIPDNQTKPVSGAIKPRILISSDIGGTDPDDNQSMAHLLMYNDLFDLEGLVSSPSFGKGNKAEILRMIDVYEKDFPQLSKHAKGLMTGEICFTNLHVTGSQRIIDNNENDGESYTWKGIKLTKCTVSGFPTGFIRLQTSTGNVKTITTFEIDNCLFDGMLGGRLIETNNFSDQSVISAEIKSVKIHNSTFLNSPKMLLLFLPDAYGYSGSNIQFEMINVTIVEALCNGKNRMIQMNRLPKTTSTVTIQKCLFSNEACAYDDTYMFYETCLCGSATTSYSDNYLTGNRMETGRKGVGAKALNISQDQLFEDFLSGNLTIKDKNSVIFINQIGDPRWIK